MTPYDLYLLEIHPDTHELVNAKLYSDLSQIIAHYKQQLEMGDGFLSSLTVDHLPDYFPLELRRDFAYPYNLVLFRGTDAKELKRSAQLYLQQIKRYRHMEPWEIAERVIVLAKDEATRFVKDNDVEDTKLLLTYLTNVLDQWRNDWRMMVPRLTLIPICDDNDQQNARDAGVRWVEPRDDLPLKRLDVLDNLVQFLQDDVLDGEEP